MFTWDGEGIIGKEEIDDENVGGGGDTNGVLGVKRGGNGDIGE